MDSDYPFGIFKLFLSYIVNRRGRDRMVVGFKTTYAISDYITTDAVSSNLDQGDVYYTMW